MKKWSELGAYQEEFSVAFAKLILWCDSHGIKVRMKDGYRDERLHGKWGEKKGYGAANSVHKLSLAVDLYTTNPANHTLMHDYWEAMGGAKRIEGDMNHYSFEWQGHR